MVDKLQDALGTCSAEDRGSNPDILVNVAIHVDRLHLLKQTKIMLP
jgi:hypothetical protein